MSIGIRRRLVLKEMMEDKFELPTERQQIMRVIKCRDNNLYKVETAIVGSENTLASMPKKFRRNILIGRGDYVLVEPIKGLRIKGHKVKVEMCKLLTPEQLKEYSRAGVWPKQFGEKHDHDQFVMVSDGEMNGDELIIRNPNGSPLSVEDTTEDEEICSTSTDEIRND
ncbi:probable RNA-binding protein EIF1AD [Anastrepha obliqua]|uniref:probable RNA-binding protein EIF1AD n=1 Tax=Anastrepha obliqua TaxID=95512 RepID=UPI002409E512|nr:probable RNA-binding protein EIF1AD [Anastrepha obliqua]